MKKTKYYLVLSTSSALWLSTTGSFHIINELVPELIVEKREISKEEYISVLRGAISAKAIWISKDDNSKELIDCLE